MVKLAVAITGASGTIYGVQFVRELLNFSSKETNNIEQIHLIISNAAQLLIKEELDKPNRSFIFGPQVSSMTKLWREEQIDATPASGSSKIDAMVIIPCSMKTMASIAHGYASNLISRTADVMLKEKRKLILVPRETPLNTIHLENMLKLSSNGAVILPASPAFYNKPSSIDDMVLFVVGKVFDQLGFEHESYKRWK